MDTNTKTNHRAIANLTEASQGWFPNPLLKGDWFWDHDCVHLTEKPIGWVLRQVERDVPHSKEKRQIRTLIDNFPLVMLEVKPKVLCSKQV